MNQKEKIQKYLQNDFKFMCGLNVVLIILGIYSGDYNYITGLTNVALIVAFIFGIKIAKNGKKMAGFFGIVMASIYILSFDPVSILLGLFMLIHSIKYLISCKNI